MKKRLWSNRKNLTGVLTVLAFLISFAGMGRAQTTAFNYQGSLKDGGTAANGSFQMQFKLFDSLSGGGQIGPTITDVPVTVTQGVFGVNLDFGSNALSGANRWLEIAVRHNSGESYVTLAPRNQIASSPYSVRTLSAASADGLSSNCVGCVQDSNINSLSGSKITGTVSNATAAATATNSSQLSGQSGSFYQNAANLNSGTLLDARLSSNVALLNTAQTFSAAKTFSAASVFNGTVGIGTASPLRALSVVGGLEVDQGNQNGSDVNTFGINFGTGLGSGIASNRSGAGVNLNGLNFYAGDNGFPRMVLTTLGQLGLGTSTPGAMLHVNGTAFVSDTVTSGAFIGSGSSLTSLNASNLSSGSLPDGRLAGTYTGALTLNNTGNAFTGSGAGLAGLNATSISTGTVADARLSANVALLTGPQTFSGTKTFSAASVFNSTVGIGTASPQRALSIVGGLVVDQGNQNTTSNGFGITFGSFSGEGISSNRGAGANPSGLDFFAGGGTTPRVSLTNSGNVGIGTTAPGERLEIDAPDATVRIRNTNDSGGGYVQNSFSTLQLGMFNPSASAVGQVPAGGKRAFFGVGADGRVGSTINLNNGNPTFRNLLDDGNGNASFNGNIAANNLPGLEFDVPNINEGDFIFDVGPDQTATLKTITVSVPTNGFIVFIGSTYAQAFSPDNRGGGTLQIYDETANTTFAQAPFTENTGRYTTETIHGALPVSAGSRTISLKLRCPNGDGDSLGYYGNRSSFVAMFFPVRY